MSEKYVYFFGADQSEGKKEMKELLGGKGANLAEMAGLGVPVPPGFTITTETCDLYYKNNKAHPDKVIKQIDENLVRLEKAMGKKLGDPVDPLLVSVRSGAAVSMPGMMDTVLNLGLNDISVQGVIKKTGNERFAWDSYRRFIQMFGDVVMEVSHSKFEKALEHAKATKGVEYDTDLTAEDLKKLVEEYKKIVKQEAGEDFPQEPRKQLQKSIDAVFGSWNNARAITYRRLNDIKGLLGTAVNIQTMVYGNMGETSGTGVAFSRNPSTGENKIYGEFLMNAQGEDVVAGIRTPRPIEELEKVMPDCYKQFIELSNKLEEHYTDMQDMEFTIQEGTLFMLQTRTGKRTAGAAVRIAVEMVDEKLITQEEALLRVDPNVLDQLLHPQLDQTAKEKAEVLAKGLPASPGAAVGEAIFTADKARDTAAEGHAVILVRKETSPEDIEGMNAAKGILTARGGMTSHAAVVARGMGKCCVAGCGDITVDSEEGQFKVGDLVIKEGDFITLDGSTGELYNGKIPVVEPELSEDFETLIKWADETRKLGVRTNADTPKDAETAIKFGAEGIGLCRTEHMFFEGERIKAVREMILSEDLEGRKKALDKLLPFQKQDFIGLFKVMKDKPVTIRLLDPPLHEFLPQEEDDIQELAKDMGVTVEKLKEKISELHEFNPMLGHRGCRLGIYYPEITEMQARAICEAAAETDAVPEIMIPLVGHVKEFINQKEIVEKVCKEILKDKPYHIGTMIEVPRGALTADEIAEHAEFFSFGTNDLTQMGCGFSRDDAGKFLTQYVELGIYEKDPFQVLDQEGVGQLIKIAVEKGKKVNPKIKLGICGEHGGEPESVKFCHRVGLTYVSCSPYRVPIARLAAAQAVLEEKAK
ncbi:pyruvate, phosphate dikinase [Candidatus Woesearchaeota archaeon]|nr:pyruvate, phosphate dikinase [Candidatus Woesearchaeota archaeon]